MDKFYKLLKFEVNMSDVAILHVNADKNFEDLDILSLEKFAKA